MVGGIADEGCGVLLWVLSPRLGVHLAKGSILNFGGLALVCYTDAVSVKVFVYGTLEGGAREYR